MRKELSEWIREFDLLQHIEPLAFPVLIMTREAPTQDRQRSVHGPIAVSSHSWLLILVMIVSADFWKV